MAETTNNSSRSKANRLALKKEYDVGLVLSGGAARGFAHLGVFKALREYGIKPGIVSGVSAGSIAGSFLCDGFEPEEVLELFKDNKIFRFVRLEFNKQGLLNISGLRSLLKKTLRTKNIEDLPIPLIITAVNIKDGTIKYFDQGDLVNAVIASSSIPVIFKPINIDGENYIDGGVNNNFPVEPIQDLCKSIIGVHVNPIGKYNPKRGVLHLALRSFHLSISSELSSKRKLISHYIEPLGLRDFSYYDIEGKMKMFNLGYEEARKVLEPHYSSHNKKHAYSK